jgi:hypothetical protein
MASSFAPTTSSEDERGLEDHPGEVVALMQNSLAIQTEMGVEVTPQRWTSSTASAKLWSMEKVFQLPQDHHTGLRLCQLHRHRHQL